MKRAKDVERFLGLSLGGAKSDRTCLTVVDYYKKQDKAFVIDSYESIGPERINLDDHKTEYTSDEVLLDTINELKDGIRLIAVDAPLTLPPCFIECNTNCPGPEKCKRSEVKWMNKQFKSAREHNAKLKYFTPYTQRPVDLYFRYKNPTEDLFQDETLGANLAPIAARMRYLQRHLKGIELIEVWPKLSIFHVLKSLKLSRKEFTSYRNLERGVHVRERILEKLVEKSQLFVYDRDYKKFVHNMAAFDSLICAWSGLQYARGQVMKFKSDVPVDSGWVQVPEL